MQNRPSQLNLIAEIKQDFKSSIEHLSFAPNSISFEDLLDFAILIGLYCVELTLLKRLINIQAGEQMMQNKEEEKAVQDDFFYDWRHIEPDENIVKILGRV